jgi:hypothetical protein
METPLRINKWDVFGEITASGFDFDSRKYGLSPRLPNEPYYYWFSVVISYKITSGPNPNREIVFDAEVAKTFKVKIFDKALPSEEELFNCIDKTKHEMGQRFYQQFGLVHKIRRALFSDYQNDIQECIRIWDTTVREQQLN